MIARFPQCDPSEEAEPTTINPLFPKKTDLWIQQTGTSHKRGHGDIFAGINSRRPNYLNDRLKNNSNIEPKTKVLYIPDVKLKFFFPAYCVPSATLCESCYARTHQMSLFLDGIVPRKIFFKKRPRAHKAHFALQNIDHLRKLVQTMLSQP